ncbi:MAG: Rpn family recombination-promoting nuclease/putative transposase [Lachnospiraceae bacterium]|nr:Rpn family recombination-promoting nuclease/putative transposase [Lachnospiraceae bacterium]
MAQLTKFQDLNLSNAFLFAAAMEDEEICKLFIETILGEQLGNITVKSERMIMFNSDFRCVRLDVFASDEKRDINVEMQNENVHNLPKRSRYHQAQMDVSSLKPGQDFNDLKPIVIIFVCTFDPFEDGLYRYTYETRCIETGKPLGDEVQKIFISTKGKNKEQVPESLTNLLNYVVNSTDNYVDSISDDNVEKLHSRIKALKKNRQLEEKYMTYEEMMKIEYSKGKREGREEGREEGTNNILRLISEMTASGMSEDIPRLSIDEEFLKEMLQKYQP